MTLDNLTQLQKTAIEGEVAKALSTARHNPEILYRVYAIMRNIPKELQGYVSEIIKEFVELSPSMLKRVTLEAVAEEVPIWLWIDKVVADVKLSIKLASMDGMICEAEADKKLMQKKIVKSAFVFFVRKTAMTCTKAARDLCRHVLDEEGLELDFLGDVCFSLIAEIDELEQSNVMPLDTFHTEFDIRDLLSFKVETNVIESHDEAQEQEVETQKTSPEDFVEDLNKASETLNKIVIELLGQSTPSEKEKPEKYAVTKEYANSPVSTTLKTFNTEAEANSYKEQIEENYPDLMKSCKLKVKKVR